MPTIEQVYLGHDNQIDLLLKEAGVAATLTNITKVSIKVGATTIDSVTTPAAFGLTGLATGLLTLKLGAQAILAGDYPACKLIIFDAARPAGLVWDVISIKVV